ncbi:hypothetical protein CA54_41800 [Symmachiella macrocystis]|uniref:Uncharacterized protein n=1 Tax=Symmachiella macrocystis TaxID=2527985 RepID=A0A5C6BBT6_9PLAN|nr:hypothetical protein CA54_41800 [Symmachiella macrocystis]
MVRPLHVGLFYVPRNQLIEVLGPIGNESPKSNFIETVQAKQTAFTNQAVTTGIDIGLLEIAEDRGQLRQRGGMLGHLDGVDQST